MKKAAERPGKPLRGIAALFDDFERKEFFKKYLFFLGWIEVLILAVSWLYQLGDGGYDRFGPVEIPFPWKTYFLISFLAPIAITFIMGVVIVGFNKYFAETEIEEETGFDQNAVEGSGEKSGRIHNMYKMVRMMQRLPFLALLLLLGMGIAFIYNLDSFFSFVASVGEKSIKIFLISAVVLVGLGSVFAMVLLVMNFQLRKRSMEYQYKSEVAERFGLVILEDNTVLNSEGKLLVSGKKWKESVPLLPAETSDAPKSESSGMAIPRPIDLEAS